MGMSGCAWLPHHQVAGHELVDRAENRITARLVGCATESSFRTITTAPGDTAICCYYY